MCTDGRKTNLFSPHSVLHRRLLWSGNPLAFSPPTPIPMSALVPSDDGVAIAISCNVWSIKMMMYCIFPVLNPDVSRPWLKRRTKAWNKCCSFSHHDIYCDEKTGGWSKSLLSFYIIDIHLRSYSYLSGETALLQCLFSMQFPCCALKQISGRLVFM